MLLLLVTNKQSIYLSIYLKSFVWDGGCRGHRVAGFSQALWDELTQNDLDSGRLLFATPMAADGCCLLPSDPVMDVLGSQGKSLGMCLSFRGFSPSTSVCLSVCLPLESLGFQQTNMNQFFFSHAFCFTESSVVVQGTSDADDSEGGGSPRPKRRRLFKGTTGQSPRNNGSDDAPLFQQEMLAPLQRGMDCLVTEAGAGEEHENSTSMPSSSIWYKGDNIWHLPSCFAHKRTLFGMAWKVCTVCDGATAEGYDGLFEN
jgi:hypothetical protein